MLLSLNYHDKNSQILFIATISKNLFFTPEYWVLFRFVQCIVQSEFKCWTLLLYIGLFTLPPAAFVTCYYQLVSINQQGVINIMN